MKKRIALFTTLMLLFSIPALAGYLQDRGKWTTWGEYTFMQDQTFKKDLTVEGTLTATATGNIYYVYSGTAGHTGHDTPTNYGTTWKKPFASIDYAVGHCQVGDIIYALPGHVDTVTAAGGIDLDVAGIQVIGLGRNDERPTINFSTATTASITVDAANITLENFIIDATGIDALVQPIDVNAAGFKMINCKVIGADSTGQATRVVFGDVNADRLRILGCEFIYSADTGPASAIELTGTSGATDDVIIADTTIRGDFTLAPIYSAYTVTNLYIDNVVAHNSNSGDFAIEFTQATTTGWMRNILAITDAFATAVDPGAMMVDDSVRWSASGSTDSASVPVFAVNDSTTNILGANSGDNSYTSNAVVANQDGSVLERLEQLQKAVNNGSGTAIGTNKSVVDLLGTTGAALVDDALSVVGILGVDDNNNAFASTNVASNRDGSILERMEDLVDQAGRGVASSTLDFTASGYAAVFTVTGGPIIIDGFAIQFLTAVDAASYTLTMISNPTSGANTSLNTGKDLDSTTQYSWFYLTGQVTDAGQTTAIGTTLPLATSTYPIIVDAGTIDYSLTTVTTTGTGKAYLRWRPLTTGVSVAP